MLTLSILQNGTMTGTYQGKTVITPSPICTLVKGGRMSAPLGCTQDGDTITVQFETGVCVLHLETGDWNRLTVEAVPDGTETFQFGPYTVPDCCACGEMLGAAWTADGGAVCIQSLSPKVLGGGYNVKTNDTTFPTPINTRAAWPLQADGRTPAKCANITSKTSVALCCAVRDMTRGSDEPGCDIVEPVPGPDGPIAGASIVLCSAQSAAELLDTIDQIETTYGLPHPTIDGTWAKKSPRADEIYFVFEGGGDNQQRIDMAQRAGVRCVYFGDPFKSWGHFDVNPSMFPNGLPDFVHFVENAKKQGVDTGFHTLSNFIRTYDPYVTPIPHKDLKEWRRTTLAQEVNESATEIRVTEDCGFAQANTLNALRIENELLRYKTYDADTKTLQGVERGAFGTKADAHKAGTKLARMSDHDYGTLYPSILLQDEMATRLGTLIKASGIRRMSFDGMEGCDTTGWGEYARSAYVRKVFETCGGDLICDASNDGHYRWHAHSYFNWGEPWWEDNRKGGSFNYRADHISFFRRNLYPCMLGWYAIYVGGTDNKSFGNRLSATTPEKLESMLSRTVGFDAGCCFCIFPGNGLLDTYLDTINRWIRFKADRVVPDEIKTRMRDEFTYWHLDETDDTWILQQQYEQTQMLFAHEHVVGMESGSTGYDFRGRTVGDLTEHRSLFYQDRTSAFSDYEPVPEPLHCRIRVGYLYQTGAVYGLTLGDAWGGPHHVKFTVTANPGDYLEYNGGTTLYHYDADLKLLETITGEGEEITARCYAFTGIDVFYVTGKDDRLDVEMTTYQTAYAATYPKK